MEAVGGIESAAAQLLHGAAMDSLGASKMEGGGMPGLFQFQTGNLERVIEFLINSVHGLATTVREESAALRSEVEATKCAQALLDKRLDVTLAAQANAQPGEDPGMRLALTELQAAVEAGQQKHDGQQGTGPHCHSAALPPVVAWGAPALPRTPDLGGHAN